MHFNSTIFFFSFLLKNVVVVFQETGEFVNTKFFCRVCSMLHEPRALSKPRSYPDFNDWWRGKGTCINGSWRKYDQAKANFEKSSRQGFCAYDQCHFFKLNSKKRLLILMHIYGILAVPTIYFCFLPAAKRQVIGWWAWLLLFFRRRLSHWSICDSC